MAPVKRLEYNLFTQDIIYMSEECAAKSRVMHCIDERTSMPQNVQVHPNGRCERDNITDGAKESK